MAATVESTAKFILDKVGGPENISSVTHCATRLRFHLHDLSLADQDAIDADDKVLGVVPQGSTGLQVIMGGDVGNYHQALVRQPGMGESGGGSAKASRGPKVGADGKKEYDGVRGKFGWVDFCFEFLSDTFRPVLWALLGASLIITLLVLADTFGIQSFSAPEGETLPPTWQFLHAMWRSVFYFLPVMVGATAARKLGANEWVGAAIPAAMLTPEFLKLGSQGDTVTVFGLPMVLNDYAGQVFPPLFAAVILYFVEKGLKKIIPGDIQMVFVPFFSLLIMIPLTAFLVGPFGIGLGNGISNMLLAINGFSPFVLAIVVPLIYPFMVPLGLHWPLNAIMIQNIASLGYDFIQGPMGAWNFACFGLVTGVMIVAMREKDASMRQVSSGGMFAGLLGGISEPSLYGVVLRFKKTYLRLLPGCFVGGVVMGLFNVKAKAFVFTSMLTVGAFDPLGGYVIGIAAAFFTSLLLVLFFDYRSAEEKADAHERIARERAAAMAEVEEAANAPLPESSRDDAAVPATAAAGAGAGAATAVAVADAPTAEQLDLAVAAPMSGTLLPLSEVPDAAFAAGKVGKGAAIDPDGDTVVAPADGKVMVTFPTGHAVGLKLDNGLQILVHIGVDTVNMDGKGFEFLVSKGDHVTAGTPLVRFDRDAIVAAGYSPITPVLVTNHRKFGSVDVVAKQGPIAIGDELLEATPKPPKTEAEQA
ncbi:glucose PTS transporter subunit IIA [Corynebacterium hansenii]|uniref:Glucose PTS transporter subunit IIA n=1 Tax=Corynebacterium hansenii TaxID=394964 RepID=A0ABV7ZK78_9CORY|nr:glucose PTS transporter subunit IIA [Corynebacterium hansenii]WJY99580.1 PTS system beta-glucoside-specific EIIBCA component [Corynebacterium hansenii]